MSPSTEQLHLLPMGLELQQLCKSISALEAIISPEWGSRYFSYQKDWNETEEVCEFRNGDGDQMLILFGRSGIVVNGFAHESRMNGWKEVTLTEHRSLLQRLLNPGAAKEKGLAQTLWKGVLDEVPTAFHEFLFGEPVKSIGTTFCIWSSKTDVKWQTGKIEFPDDDFKDGSADLLSLLDGAPSTYKEWAEEYYDEQFEDRKLNLELVQEIYNHKPISKELAHAINPELEDLEKLKADLAEIGYPAEL